MTDIPKPFDILSEFAKFGLRQKTWRSGGY